MNSNPFTSSTFETTWSKYYDKKKKAVAFNFVNGVKFIKTPFFLFKNIGKNFTNGITYSINNSAIDYKNKAILLYDVPDYFLLNNKNPINISIKKVRQYKGFYADLSKFKNIDDVLAAYFNSSKSRYNFRRSLKQLDEKLQISYKVYFGAISKEDYNKEMSAFKELLGKRFDEKNTFNTVLPMWDFYQELIYPLILEKKVVFNVVYNSNVPIAMSINFLNNDVLMVSIRTFDVDFNKMNIGNIEIYKLLEWSLDNGIKKLDFSKGESYYKKRWTDTAYFYYHHIVYDKKSPSAILVANGVVMYFKFKQFLRDKNVNALYTKLKYVFAKQK
ncbi:GNAT family N-acetyltransferase [Ichthyenterobacterium magnum]|uniref:Acetyltransferase (GNAT) family protein n=1 Tax=Ichthyenterobacterium magnum TaxID=1230530 RepID=A0A420DLX3_9FLAO|nr:GNAT family N-acetyltransferase [Ichthyenterobacterium magnum]RKE95294.1 acetyltransferase (GNAT) family protein [Ichthyenterobacterium magnum]